jgi:hypothetical protein
MFKGTYLSVLGAAAVLGAASAADATVYNVNLTALSDGTYTAGFSSTVSGAGPFSDTFNFTIPIPGNASSTLATIVIGGLANINFTTVLLNSTGNPPVGFSINNGSLDQATLTLASVLPGAASIVVNGSVVNGTGGSYGGGANVAPLSPDIRFTPIPEPASWAMMILGMGMAGFGLRMRRRNPLTS